MAKIKRNAKAVTIKGDLANGSTLTKMLAVLGKNRKLFSDLEDVFTAELVDTFVRPFQLDGEKHYVVVTAHTDIGILTMSLLNHLKMEKGSAIFVYTDFFENISDVEDSPTDTMGN